MNEEPAPAGPYSIIHPAAIQYIERSGVSLEDVQIIRSDDDRHEAFRKWGLPNSLAAGPTVRDILQGTAGLVWIDDDTGKVMAYKPYTPRAHPPRR